MSLNLAPLFMENTHEIDNETSVILSEPTALGCAKAPGVICTKILSNAAPLLQVDQKTTFRPLKV
jgi:hypothetical protein